MPNSLTFVEPKIDIRAKIREEGELIIKLNITRQSLHFRLVVPQVDSGDRIVRKSSSHTVRISILRPLEISFVTGVSIHDRLCWIKRNSVSYRPCVTKISIGKCAFDIDIYFKVIFQQAR